jgi:methionyl-tRNA formyltransferase
MGDDGPVGLRIVFITTVAPIATAFVEVLDGLGHDPLAVVGARRPEGAKGPDIHGIELTDGTVPKGVDLLLPRDKRSLEPLLRTYEPDVVLCYAYPWKIPLEALEVPRFGSANHHPALLPRHRGPIPFAWTLREGDRHFGSTWHRMDAELDTGAILAQTSVPVEDTDTTILDVAPKVAAAAAGTLPQALERLVAGDPGDPQDDAAATWAGWFEEDYATVDWSWPARAVHDQVRAWALELGLSKVVGPIAVLDGEPVRLLRTSLTDPGGGAQRVECGDGPLWILESEPAPAG